MAAVTFVRTDKNSPTLSLELEVLRLGKQLIVHDGSADFERFWDALKPAVMQTRFDLTLGENTFRKCAVHTVGTMAIRNGDGVRQLIIEFESASPETEREQHWRVAGRSFFVIGVSLLILDLSLVRPLPRTDQLFHGLAIASVYLFGVPLAQALVSRAIRLCAMLFAPNVPGGQENHWPQRFVGVLESTFYPVIFTWFEGTAPEIVGAWIGLKTFGDWSRFKGSTDDEDVGRRRLYRFMVGNALQVASALAMAWLIKRLRA